MSKLKAENKYVQKICLTLLYFVIGNPIDYRTQAIAAEGNPVVAGMASRALKELDRTGKGSVEVTRRHSPIIPILVEISKSIHISVGK